jgi:uncharacterized protein YqgC (DUF456 family)
MDGVLIAIGIILLLVGVIGAIVPGIPGPTISFIGLLLLHFTERYSYSADFLWIMGLIMVVVTALDYVVPVWGTKKFGGSKRGMWGSTIGLIIGIFFLPALGIVLGPFGLFGIILGPFLGAYIGESTGGKSQDESMRAAFGAFIGFLAGTFMKFAYSIVVGIYFFIELF